MERKLFRNEHDKMIGGVASGLADYLQIEVTIVRLLFALATVFLAGAGFIAYVVIWIVAPSKNNPTARFSQFNDYYNSGSTNNPNASANWSQPLNQQEKQPFETQSNFPPYPKKSDTGRTIAGLILLVVGCFFLLHQLDLIPYWFNIRNFFRFLWPMIFIALGISIIARSKRKNEWETFQNQQTQQNPVTDEQKDTVDFSEVNKTTENQAGDHPTHQNP